jgi:hypothetical protein
VCGQGQCKLLTNRTTNFPKPRNGHREQAHSYIWNAFPCRSEPARDSALKANKSAPGKVPLSVGALMCNETLAPLRSQ